LTTGHAKERTVPNILKWFDRPPFGSFVFVSVALLAIQAVGLLAMGQPPICTCGYVKFWHGIVQSDQNSQQIADWYTFSHVIHGIAFYFVLWLIAPKSSVWLRFAIAIAVEVSWEILENTPMIIDRYRESALAQGYVGDSVINSVFDTLAAALGFFIARTFPVWLTVALVVVFEVFVGYMIRDNLILNIVQLLFPSEAISKWQSGG
jgi:hypothetical protein